MPVVRHPDELPVVHGDGYTETACADAQIFGEPVPMRARRFLLEPGSTAPTEIAGDEAMVYVARGSGVLEVGAERHDLAPESMVWIEPPATVTMRAGNDGMDVLVSEAPGR